MPLRMSIRKNKLMSIICEDAYLYCFNSKNQKFGKYPHISIREDTSYRSKLNGTVVAFDQDGEINGFYRLEVSRKPEVVFTSNNFESFRLWLPEEDDVKAKRYFLDKLVALCERRIDKYSNLVETWKDRRDKGLSILLSIGDNNVE